MTSLKKVLKLAIRIDDPPTPIGRSDPDPCLDEIENIETLAEKHQCPLTLAVPLGWLHDLKHLHSAYKRLRRNGLISVACHGWYHEDFSGVGVVFREKTTARGVSLTEADQILKRCQDFALHLFGEGCIMFIAPFFREPADRAAFNNILLANDFTSISNLALEDPLCEGFEREVGLWEVPYVAWIDPFERKPYRTVRYVKHDADTLSRYMDAVKMLIDYRFSLGLYVHILTHSMGFWDTPVETLGFPGLNPSGRFFDELLTWVRKKYSEVRFVPVEGLVEEER